MLKALVLITNAPGTIFFSKIKKKKINHRSDGRVRPENRSVGEGLKGAVGITSNFQLEKYK